MNLAIVLNVLCVSFFVSFNVANAVSKYKIEASVNDETFIINSEVFKAKTYCFNANKGDQVIFTKGSAYGTCTSAEFVILRTGNKCEVWCE